jgi:hypothetical protein
MYDSTQARSSHRQRVPGVGFGNVIHAEVAAENGPGLAGIGSIGGGGPIVLLEGDEVGENRRLINRVVKVQICVVKKVGVIVHRSVGQALHFVPVGHSPAARS